MNIHRIFSTKTQNIISKDKYNLMDTKPFEVQHENDNLSDRMLESAYKPSQMTSLLICSIDIEVCLYIAFILNNIKKKHKPCPPTLPPDFPIATTQNFSRYNNFTLSTTVPSPKAFWKSLGCSKIISNAFC